MLDQKDLDVVVVMDVLVFLEVVGRCLEGLEDVANPNDVEHAVYGVLLVFEDALDVHLVDVHYLLVLDLLDDLLALDVELLLDDDFLDDPLVLDGADAFHDLVYDDVLDLLLDGSILCLDAASTHR